MIEARTEYILQEQIYRRNIAEIYDSLFEEINALPNNKLSFKIEPAQGKNDEKRYYIRSYGTIWELMRRISLPNLSYISIMQLLTPDNKIELYFRLFMNYEYNSMNHPKLIANEEEELIESNVENGKKNLIKQARI